MMTGDKNPLLVILGPTASGKTKLAVRLAEALNGEIISADSRQVFTGMDIGTGKDLNEYVINGKHIPYHLINIKQAGEKYNVNEFKDDFYNIFNELSRRNTLPVLCGGTGMYIHSILCHQPYTAIPVNEFLRKELEEYNIAALREKVDTYPPKIVGHADRSSVKRLIRAIEIAEYLSNNEFFPAQRPSIAPFVAGLTSEVNLRRSKIISRMQARFNEGMIEEVQSLLKNGVPRDMLSFYGLEYKLIAAYLFHEIDFIQLKELLGTAICQFAKRQMTFFRKMEKDGIKIHWFDTDQQPESLFKTVLSEFQKIS